MAQRLVPPVSANVHSPPDGSSTNDEEERFAKLLDLSRQHPGASHAELAGLARVKQGLQVSLKEAGWAIRVADAEWQQERHGAPLACSQRLAKLVSARPAPARGKLRAAYQAQDGIRIQELPRPVARRKPGVPFVELRPGAKTDAAANRAQRVWALAISHPKLTYSQLADLYKTEYGIKIRSYLVGKILRKFGINGKKRGCTSKTELRTAILKELVETNPLFTTRSLAAAYEKIYQVALSPRTINNDLRRAGVPRRPYSVRLQPFHEYQTRIIALAQENPHASYGRLAASYYEQYGVKISRYDIRPILKAAGIPHTGYKPAQAKVRKDRKPRERPAKPVKPTYTELNQQIADQLKAIASEFSNMDKSELIAEYAKRHGETLNIRSLQALSHWGIVLRPAPCDMKRYDQQMMQQRIERLQAIAAECPNLNTNDIIKEYARRHGQTLDVGATRGSLRYRGIRLRPSRKDVQQRRVERLKAIAAELPELLKSEVIREYNRRYGERLEYSATRSMLSARKVEIRSRADLIKLRNERIRAIAAELPYFTKWQVINEYTRRYCIKPKEDPAISALRKQRVVCRPPRNDEMQIRIERLRTIVAENPYRSQRQIAEEYNQRHEQVCHGTLFHTMNRYGIKVQNSSKRMQLRIERLTKISEEYPNMCRSAVIREYANRYHETLNATSTSRLLQRLGVVQTQGDVTRRRIERLKEIAAQYPHLTQTAVIKEYCRLYGETLGIEGTMRLLKKHNVSIRCPQAPIIQLRLERLKAIAAENPQLNKSEVVLAYCKKYGENIKPSAALALLRAHGGLFRQSKSEIVQQRIERLKAIAAENPKMNKTQIVMEYCNQSGETLSVKPFLERLRRKRIALR